MQTFYPWACKEMSAGSICRKIYNLIFFSKQYCRWLMKKIFAFINYFLSCKPRCLKLLYVVSEYFVFCCFDKCLWIFKLWAL